LALTSGHNSATLRTGTHLGMKCLRLIPVLASKINALFHPPICRMARNPPLVFLDITIFIELCPDVSWQICSVDVCVDE